MLAQWLPLALFTFLILLVCSVPFLKRKEITLWWQYILTRLQILIFLKKLKKKVTFYTDLQKSDLTPAEIGIIPSPLEYELEKSCQSFLKHCDGIHFIGINSERNFIDVCVNRIEKNLALVWVYLKLSNGSICKMPFDKDVRKIYIGSENMFSSSGLQIKMLSPFRKWRISFNGLLWKYDTRKTEKLIHVKFSFVWLAMSAVQELNFANTVNELTNAFMSECKKVEEKDLISLQKFQNRYEQWGQMIGTLHLAEEQEKELYFWSARTRIKDTPLWNEDIKCAKFYMYFMNGIPLKIENVSVRSFFSNLTSAYTITPYGAPVLSDCCFNINQFKENAKEIQFLVNLRGNKEKIHIVFDEGCSFHFGPDLQLQMILKTFKVYMDNCDYGYGIFHYLIRLNRQVEKQLKTVPLLLRNPGYTSCKNSVLNLDDKICKSPEIAGGKGSSLAQLIELSKKTDMFIIPKGLIISTNAFEEHLEINKDISDSIQTLKDVSCKKIKANLKEECMKCSLQFKSTQLSDFIKKEIEVKLLDLYGSLENARFAIRSSACGEDNEDLSAAGQMLTILDVKGINNIFQAIIQCWSSKFSYEYVQYSRQNGQSILSPMAIIIQQLVPSEYSGVMFTVDPVSGNPLNPHITANFGLGESVVSALVDPDTVLLKRGENDSLQIHSKYVGSKKTQIFAKRDGVEQNTVAVHYQECCLSDEWAIKIGNVGLLVETCFCSPRDIEWAIYNHQLYLLQARPITTLHTETDFELIHDQDTPVRSVNDYWTRANTGEVFLGATSPLGISLVVAGMDIYGHKYNVVREKCYDEFCPYFFHILPVTHKQITLNLLDTIFRFNEKEISGIQKALEVALFGRSVITEEMHQAGIKRFGYMPVMMKYFSIVFIFLLIYIVPKTIIKVNKQLSKFSVPLETYTSSKEAWNGILGQMNFYNQVFHVHRLATFLSSYFNMGLITILSKEKKDWDAELYGDFATMLSSCSEVESADVPERLQELAKEIAVNYGSKFSLLSIESAYQILKNDVGSSGILFQEFIQNHGHRCVKEFDVYSKSWEMQPEGLIPTLQNMISSSNIFNSIAKNIMTTEDIISKIKTPVSNFNKKILKIFLPMSRKYLCQREKTKSMVIRGINWLRKSCYHLGELMVNEGFLPECELVFFLTAEELIEIFESQKPGLVPKAFRRMQLHSQLNDLKFPEIMKGIPRPIKDHQDNSKYSISFTLTGTPVCQGKVKGRAVVMLSLDDSSQIKSGDILVTQAIDIGWSPYFPLLSGVITVLGGLISHGAVVAREYGLPCVVGIENATVAFNTGDTIILNGMDGTVTKVLDEENI